MAGPYRPSYCCFVCRWCCRWCCRWAVIFISYTDSYNTGAVGPNGLLRALLHTFPLYCPARALIEQFLMMTRTIMTFLGHYTIYLRGYPCGVAINFITIIENHQQRHDRTSSRAPGPVLGWLAFLGEKSSISYMAYLIFISTISLGACFHFVVHCSNIKLIFLWFLFGKESFAPVYPFYFLHPYPLLA